MAVTPKTVRRKPVAKKPSSTLSASEALKAADAALSSAHPVGAKPSTRKVADVKPKPAPVLKPKETRVVEAEPVQVIAATTAVDAAPEPEAVLPDPEPAIGSPLPEIESTESLSLKAEPVEPKPLATEGTKMMNEVIENGKKFAADAKAKLETVYADFNEKAKAGVEKSTKAVEELSDLAKGNVEAMVESGKIAAKGFEALGQEAADYGRKSLEKATASLKSFSTVKTPTEFFQLHSQLISSSFDEFAKEMAKGGEALIKLTSDVAQPLTARVTVVTDKVKSLTA